MNKTTFNKSQFVTLNSQQCFSFLCYENNLINIKGYMWIN
jgi:hypothetical protein